MNKLKKVKYLVIHCSASRWGTAADINQWHKARGFTMIGYHAVILNGYRTFKMQYEAKFDGVIEKGRPEKYMGAHCAANGMNICSLGVCLIGTPGFDTYPTKKQYDSLIHVLSDWYIAYNLSPSSIITQHSTWEKKKPLCASLKLDKVRSDVMNFVEILQEARKQ